MAEILTYTPESEKSILRNTLRGDQQYHVARAAGFVALGLITAGVTTALVEKGMIEVPGGTTGGSLIVVSFGFATNEWMHADETRSLMIPLHFESRIQPIESTIRTLSEFSYPEAHVLEMRLIRARHELDKFAQMAYEISALPQRQRSLKWRELYLSSQSFRKEVVSLPEASFRARSILSVAQDTSVRPRLLRLEAQHHLAKIGSTIEHIPSSKEADHIWLQNVAHGNVNFNRVNLFQIDAKASYLLQNDDAE
jgi:hypothetical protein